MSEHGIAAHVQLSRCMRPMTGRDPRERGRTATTLELLFDVARRD
jgi:hypothetical protein